MKMFDDSAVLWRKSSRSSAQGGNCVEVAGLSGRIAIRDSKNPTGPILTFDTTTFSTFLNRLRQTTENR